MRQLIHTGEIPDHDYNNDKDKLTFFNMRDLIG